MLNNSTFISDVDTKKLAKLCAEQIREFLNFLNYPDKASIYSEVKNRKKNFSQIESPIFDKAKHFQKTPNTFSDRNLIKYGQKVAEAVGHPVRIEIRKVEGISGTAQIAVRGVYGIFRTYALNNIISHKAYDPDRFFVRLSGNASFEINRHGVDKALPIKYFCHKWHEVLNKIQYTPGSCIDSFRTNSLIAADGDGTTFDSPRLNEAPGLDTSAAYTALLRFMELGGVYVIISGNHLERTITRVQKFIPKNVISRLLVAANGGANLVYFDPKGKVKEIQDYRKNALACIRSEKPKDVLDLIYIGDDGRFSGNDKEAFEEVGPGRSILVAKDTTDDIIPFLRPNHIGGLVAGTRSVLEFVNQWVVLNPRKKIFTKNTIDKIIRSELQ